MWYTEHTSGAYQTPVRVAKAPFHCVVGSSRGRPVQGRIIASASEIATASEITSASEDVRMSVNGGRRRGGRKAGVIIATGASTGATTRRPREIKGV